VLGLFGNVLQWIGPGPVGLQTYRRSGTLSTRRTGKDNPLTRAALPTRLPPRHQGAAVIRLGIVGCNYGRTVQLPAFRLDPRCRVVALAGTDPERTTALAREAEVPEAFGDWTALVEHPDVDAVAIATPPSRQPEIAIRALALGKPVFAEKPLAADVAGAAAMLRQAGAIPTMIDFSFTELPAWRTAKSLLDQGAIGGLRHVAVSWNVENASTRLRLKNWKTSGAEGGGALGNFASHSLHYLEWFCGPIVQLSAHLSGLPDDPAFETNVTLSLDFSSGASGSYAMSCASYLGSGHRLEFYGEDGTLLLDNPTSDYMRRFALSHARRPAEALEPIAVEPDPRDRQFPTEARIAPVSRLAGRFLDAVERRTPVSPGFAEGYRVQVLLDAVRLSQAQGCRIKPAEGAA
jgi:predicted dehydrogenase